MYAWYIYTRLDGSSCLGHKCKVVCVKFLNSLYFLHPFIYSSTSWEYPGHHASNFILFVWRHPTCTLFITIIFVFLGELSDHHCKPVHLLSLTYVLFHCRVSPPWNNFPIYFFLFSMLSNLVLGHVYFLQPFYQKTKHQSLPNVKLHLQILLLLYLLTPQKSQSWYGSYVWNWISFDIFYIKVKCH